MTMLALMKKTGIKEYPNGYSIEVEAEFKRGVDLGSLQSFDNFAMKADGSLINGIEFISMEPQNKNKLKESIFKLLEKSWFNGGYSPSERTSTHIHVNVQHWSREELFTFLTIYYLVEPLLFNFTGESRKSNLFCLPLYEAENATSLFQPIWELDFRQIQRMFDRFKYSALNIASVGRIGTVEFRHMYGTNNFKALETWIDLVDCIVRARSKYPSAEVAFEAFQNNRRAFIENVFGVLLPHVDSYDWFDLVDRNYSMVYYLINLPEELRRVKKKKEYKFKTEKEEDDLKYMGF